MPRRGSTNRYIASKIQGYASTTREFENEIGINATNTTVLANNNMVLYGPVYVDEGNTVMINEEAVIKILDYDDV